MALLNPVYAIAVPSLLVVTLPLALLAGVTTTLAFSALIFRVVVVYLDVALSLVPQSLAGLRPHGRHADLDARPPAACRASRAGSRSRSRASSAASSAHQQQQHPLFQRRRRSRRRRRLSSSANAPPSSGGTTTPIGGDFGFGLGLVPSVGADRDFEGIGGWRSGDDDQAWTTINSRMELPDRGGFAKHHYRTPSGGGATTPGDGGVLMMKTTRRSPEPRTIALAATSPNTSRTRTPSASRMQSFATLGSSDGYFPLAMSPKANKKLQLPM
ncbi:uncharacterized protein UV8b_00903 [Ustilaginoidea virens]|uniref:Uncharacterized protein n=1 Tax=Ustilaginoidea virens TaxID=1159556 RepID=A0A8E5HJY9_USTVR|nr:uncharacterized protein UV8b_00903 [Ustilaginoidea virens]QUC16662.1 hypothetical protein UV8b_00903 [Ustilaginoidea virens]